MTTPSQDYSAAITWTQDWTQHLALNGSPTITSASVSCTDVRVTLSAATVTGGKLVTFKVSQTGITTPTIVTIAVTANLSNGDIDQRDFLIQFTNT